MCTRTRTCERNAKQTFIRTRAQHHESESKYRKHNLTPAILAYTCIFNTQRHRTHTRHTEMLVHSTQLQTCVRAHVLARYTYTHTRTTSRERKENTPNVIIHTTQGKGKHKVSTRKIDYTTCGAAVTEIGGDARIMEPVRMLRP